MKMRKQYTHTHTHIYSIYRHDRMEGYIQQSIRQPNGLDKQEKNQKKVLCHRNLFLQFFFLSFVSHLVEIKRTKKKKETANGIKKRILTERKKKQPNKRKQINIKSNRSQICCSFFWEGQLVEREIPFRIQQNTLPKNHLTLL